MKTSTDFSRRSHTLTCEDLIDANTDFVKGVIYECDDTGFKDVHHVTPASTFNGWVCDCYLVERRGRGFGIAKGAHIPIPIQSKYLGEPVAVILHET